MYVYILMFSLLFSLGAYAQTYPEKPVRIIVGFSAGGSGDMIARLVARRFTEVFGQQFIVENRPGASSNIGSAYVAKAAPDGYTLLMGSHTMASNTNLFKRLPFDMRRDFAPIVVVDKQPNALVLHPSVPARTLQEFVKLAKAQPGKLNYASAGPGSGQHMSVVQFTMITGVDMTHITYKGGAPAVIDLIAGQVDLMIGNLPETMPFVQAGKLRALAVTSVRRQAMLPGVPTMQEAGLRNYEHVGWHGLYAPAATSKDIISKLNAELNKALASSDLPKRLEALGLEVAGGSVGDFQALIEREIEQSARLVKEAGIPQQ